MSNVNVHDRSQNYVDQDIVWLSRTSIHRFPTLLRPAAGRRTSTLLWVSPQDETPHLFFSLPRHRPQHRSHVLRVSATTNYQNFRPSQKDNPTSAGNFRSQLTPILNHQTHSKNEQPRVEQDRAQQLLEAEPLGARAEHRPGAL